MKIAVTSQNFTTVTGHAGMARRFIVFSRAADSAPAEVARLDLAPEMAFHGFAGGPHPLDGVDAIVTESAGSGFVRKMQERGIRVVMTHQSDPLTAVADILAGRSDTPAAGADGAPAPNAACGCNCGDGH